MKANRIALGKCLKYAVMKELALCDLTSLLTIKQWHYTSVFYTALTVLFAVTNRTISNGCA